MIDGSGDHDVVIEARGLARSFGHVQAVRGIDLTVRRGQIFGFLGPNGSGKSTTIRMLCGILSPTAGSATVLGVDVTREPEKVKARIGYMTQRFSLYEDLTVEENLAFFAGVYGVPGGRSKGRIEEIVAATSLAWKRRELAGSLSGGWKQRLALAAALLHAPPLMILDEPTAGVDPLSRRQFWDLVADLALGGTTFLVSTHYMDEAERCHEIAIMVYGRIIARGSPAELVGVKDIAVYNLETRAPREAMILLRGLPGVHQVAPFGPVLRVVAAREGPARERIASALQAAGIPVTRLDADAPSLEDVFIHHSADELRREMTG
ncbi:MAG: ABC transporter ATP-binding protein [Acidobacteria bacterium]|nr:ABC transporter ATP-binding protein [Acidobacteriota bacterium]